MSLLRQRKRRSEVLAWEPAREGGLVFEAQTLVSLSSRRKDLLGPVTRVKKSRPPSAVRVSRHTWPGISQPNEEGAERHAIEGDASANATSSCTKVYSVTYNSGSVLE